MVNGVEGNMMYSSSTQEDRTQATTMPCRHSQCRITTPW